MTDPSSRYRYFKEIKGIIKTCIRCGELWYPKVYSKHTFNACAKCKRALYREWYRDYWKPRFDSLPEDKKAYWLKLRLKNWHKWVEKHTDRRRAQALASYHKNKGKKKNINRRKKYYRKMREKLE